MLRFVTFEGGDGSGKTTQVRMLDAHLRARNILPVVTREPGDSSIGKGVRRLLLERQAKALSPEAELFLIAADRAQHVREIIAPALSDGRLVLCDRYADSTVAYQGYGRRFDLPLLRSLNDLATGGLIPDLTLLFDCPPELALSRAAARIEDENAANAFREDRFEAEGIEFHKRVREGFLRLARAEPSRFVVLDGGASPESVHAGVRSVIDERLQETAPEQ